MNTKRKADLQRRLSLAPVPRPPAGLADRIKSDIPEYLRPETDRRRLARSVAFSMRVAASILVVISSVIAAIYLLAPEEEMMRMSPTPQIAAVAEDKSLVATDELQVEIAQQAAPPAVVRLGDVPASLGAASPETDVVERTASRRKEEGRRSDGVEYDVAGTVAGGAVANTTTTAVAAVSEPPADFVSEVPVAPAPAPAAPPPAVAESITVQAAAPKIGSPARTSASFVREAQAAALAFGPPSDVFGISIDEGVFHRIKETLESNRRPTAAAVNVEAIINYFAGGPVKPPRRGVKLEVEGSPSPVGGVGARGGYLRFTIDTPVSQSQLPVAADAKLEIELNSKVVESASPVGDSAITAPESALRHNLSVTGLYHLTLKPNMRTTDRVATVRLHYTAVGDGKSHSLQKTVYVRDFVKLWTKASRRHRVASLGAVWAESLRAASPVPDVVKRAEELATQNPRDERAQELATAANASSKLPANGF